LLTGSGDEFCGPLPALLQAVAYQVPTVSLPPFPGICLLIVQVEISSLVLLPSPLCFQHSHSLCYVLVFSLLFIVQFFFFLQWCQSAQGPMLVYHRGGWGNTTWGLVCTCLVCWMSPKQVCSWRWWRQWQLAVMAVHLFSQCNMAWRSFLRARCSGCWNFHSPWCFISTNVAPASQQGFWVTELMLSASAP
jgi:hypothetical protein